MSSKLSICTLVLSALMLFGLPAGVQAEEEGQKDRQSTQQRDEKAMKGLMAVVGEVGDARDVTIAGAAGNQHKLVKLKTKGDKNVVIDLGVQGAGGFSVEKGDKIFVLGHSARINDKPVIFAKYAGTLEKVGNVGENGSSR